MSASDILIPLKLAVLTVSDTRDESSDSSGAYLVESLQEAGHTLTDKQIVKDDIYQIRAVISAWIASPQVDAVLVTGGTGFSGAFSVAEVGAKMDNSDKKAPPPAPDVSHLSMAQAGEVLGQKKEEKAPVVPDISHLSLKDD
ncbi:molybdopterin-binding protein [uncultured Spongiibacter sp.]|uniref:molybdopterin-binding protein n=1 Tax=uncultured Spongiibacter sp. TaxID=870896 RepID=UPI0025989B9D|nr:molybdopterin-binding protein [uncultured Spongiibacter sp.]